MDGASPQPSSASLKRRSAMIEAYTRLHDVRAAAREVGISVLTAYLDLKLGGVLLTDDALRIGCTNSRRGAEGEREFQRLVPWATDMNAEVCFNNPGFDFRCNGARIDIKTCTLLASRRGSPDSPYWNISVGTARNPRIKGADLYVAFLLTEQTLRDGYRIFILPAELLGERRYACITRNQPSIWDDFEVRPEELSERLSVLTTANLNTHAPIPAKKNRPKQPWSEEELRIVRERYPHTTTAKLAAQMSRGVISINNIAHKLRLKKSPEHLASVEACRLRRGDHAGVAHRFKPGHVPANKGLRRPGWAPGRMSETQYKAGNISGRAADLYQPIGSERLSKDGYTQRKIHNGLPMQSRWRGVHILAWEAVNGPLPKGHAIVFRDGDKKNFDLGNLECVTRAELMRRNSYHNNYPKEIAQVIQLRGALVRKINRRKSK